MCHAMYDCAWMKMSESFRFVFHPNLFYSSFIFPRLNKCKCHAPNHADKRLWTINLNVNFSMNASKMWCEPRFLVLIQVLFDKDANAVSYVADVLYKDGNAKFIHDGASGHIYTMMQMSPCRYVMMQMTPCRYAMMQMI